MAGQSITFDFLSRGAASLSRDFRSIGDDSALSSRGVKVLQDVIEKLGAKENRTAAESKILASALRQTGDASATAAAKAVIADAAIRRLGDSMADSEKKTGGLGKALGNLKLNPGLAGPALALAPGLGTLTGVVAGAGAGLAGAFVAGGAALAAFGAVAKPVLTGAKTAATAVETAQNAHAAAVAKVTGQYQYAMSVAKTQAQRQAAYAAEQKGFSAAQLAQTAAVSKAYANLSPAQIALSKQLGDMASAWDKVKTAQTPVVAGALQPWLRSVTDLTKQLAPVIAAVAPVIQGLGKQFDALINSAAFKGFRVFIAGTGTAAVSATGSTIIDLVKSFIILLPKFDPLIREAVGWISRLGPAVLAWSSSKKASDDIQAFIRFFSANGQVVGDLLKNIGLALKALAPGLTAGGAVELKVISDFLGLVAKLPPAFAKPLTEVAGALLILSKLGVLKVGVQIVGAAAKWLAGGLVNLGGGAAAGAEIRAAMVSGGAAAGAEIRAAMTGGGAAGGAAGAAKAAVPGAALGGLSLGTFAGLAAGGAAIGAGFILAVRKAIESGWKGILGILPQLFGGAGGILNLSAAGWTNAILDKFDKPIRRMWDLLGHWLASKFDEIRHTLAPTWNATWNDSIGTVIRFGHNVETQFNSIRHQIAVTFDGIRHDIATAWDTIWNNTVGRVIRGVGDTMRWVGTLPGRITGVFRGAGDWLTGAGKDVLQGLWNGLTSIWTKVMTWIGGIAGWIKAHKGPVSLDASLLYPAGSALMSGFLGGLKAGFGPVGSFVGGIASWVLGKIAGAGGKLTGGLPVLDPSQFSASALAGAVGGGVQRWRGTVQQALRLAGANAAQLTDPVLYQMQTESGGNPTIVNRTDSNWLAGHPSVGLMQVIAGTFASYAGQFRNTGPFEYGVSVNPLANIYAAIKYAQANYGPGLRNAYGGIGTGHGYAYGTSSAAPGWAWVGERGVPELIHFRGGEQVGPVYAGARGGHGGGNTYSITVNVPPTASKADTGRAVVECIREYERGSGTGWRR